MKHERVEARVAARLRALRRQRGLTVDAVARAAGVSKSLVSKLENALVSSRLATYTRVAAAVGTTLGDLMHADDDGACVVVRRRERPRTARAELPGYKFEALARTPRDTRMAPFVVTYPAGRAKAPRHTHAGEELVFVMKGRIELMHGGVRFVLACGDAAYLDGRVPHGGRALGRTPAVAVVVTAWVG